MWLFMFPGGRRGKAWSPSPETSVFSAPNAHILADCRSGILTGTCDWLVVYLFFSVLCTYAGSRTFSWYRGLSVTQVSVGDPSNLILFDQAGQGQNQFFKCVGAFSIWGKWVFLLYVHPEKNTQHIVPQNSSRTLVTFLRFSKKEEALVIQPWFFICAAPYKAKTLSIIFLPEDCSYNYFINVRKEKINVVCCRA